jgi:hypothetical protein
VGPCASERPAGMSGEHHGEGQTPYAVERRAAAQRQAEVNR